MTNTFTNKNPGYRPMHVIHPVFLPFTFLIGRDKLETWKGRDWVHHRYRYDKDSSPLLSLLVR